MQTPRGNQPIFFDLSVQQRGATSHVLETIAREEQDARLLICRILVSPVSP